MLERGLFEGQEATQGSIEKRSELRDQQAGGKRILGAVVLKFNTSIIQAKKFILVVKRLLCVLRSLSDSLIPSVETC